MALLGNKFSPLTQQFGFLQGDLHEIVRQYSRWQHLILRLVWKKEIDGALEAKLGQILPPDDCGEHVLFTSTRSEWVAVFDNRVGGGIAENAITILSGRMKTRGLMITDVPNTFKRSGPPHARGQWGAISMCEYNGTVQTECVGGWTRYIGLANDVDGWEFAEEGTPWPFEDTERYASTPIPRRIDAELLARYFEHFGIQVFDDDFYDGPAIATRSRFPLNAKAKTFDLGELQRKLRIDVGVT